MELHLLESILMAFAVAVDAFAVSISSGLLYCKNPWRNGLLAGAFFGGFQFIMPAGGYFAGEIFSRYFDKFDHWAAFLLLAFVGGKMIWDGIKGEETEEAKNIKNPFTLKNLFVLAVATSIDACAVGASLAMSGRKILLAATLMGIVTALASIIGVKLGAKFGHFFSERKIIIAGGLVLVGIGIKIVPEHLFK